MVAKGKTMTSRLNGMVLIRQRVLIWQLIQRELGQRYRGSYLGFLWSIITPLFMLLIYTFVFSGIFKARWQVNGPRPRPAILP